MANKQFVSNRDIIIRSKTGHAIEFKKDVPMGVPEVMHSEVMEKGILPVDEAGKVDTTLVVGAEKPVILAPEDAHERAKRILEVIRAIVKRNNSNDFAGGGVPAAGAISTTLGWVVDQKEARQVWEKHRQEILAPK